jgi:acylphosphatase
LDPNLRTFTIVGWTSQSRKISNPYDLVFNLRPADDLISAKEAKVVWNTIAEGTLKGEDLAKFMKHLEDDE